MKTSYASAFIFPMESYVTHASGNQTYTEDNLSFYLIRVVEIGRMCPFNDESIYNKIRNKQQKSTQYH